MTDHEWEMTVAELEATFRGGLEADRAAILRTHFGHMDYGSVRTAILRLSAGGQVFVPVPGELHAAITAMDTVRSMTFAEALPIVLDELLKAKRGAKGREAEALVGAVSVIAERCGEGAARWARSRGFGLLLEQLYDPDMGGAIKGAMSKDYAAVCSGAEEDRRTGLALEQAQQAALSRGGGLRQIDPAAAVEQAAPRSRKGRDA